MSRSDSVRVLNETDSTLNSIDLALAQSNWDWSPDIEWWPGDPLYSRPGNFVRPIFQVLEFGDDTLESDVTPSCLDCDIITNEDTCWVCGKKLYKFNHKPIYTVTAERNVLFDMEFNVRVDMEDHESLRRHYERLMAAGYFGIVGFDTGAYSARGTLQGASFGIMTIDEALPIPETLEPNVVYSNSPRLILETLPDFMKSEVDVESSMPPLGRPNPERKYISHPLVRPQPSITLPQNALNEVRIQREIIVPEQIFEVNLPDRSIFYYT